MTSRTRKNRLQDIAKHAGVGMATVDRVLNERGGVSEKTALRVLESAKALGTRRMLPQSSRRRLSIEAVMARSPSAYYKRLNLALQSVNKFIDIPVTIYRTHIDVTQPEKLVRHIEKLADSRDGIILFASDLPQVARAIKANIDKTMMVTISTDILDSGRHCYVGIDNFNAGQSAAKLSEAICRKGGKVLVIRPETRAQAQLQRYEGFKQFFEDRNLGDKLVSFQQDRVPSLALAQIASLLQSQSEIRVLYSPVNNNFMELLVEAGRDEPAIRALAKIVHDLSPHSVANLRAGLIDIVLDSNPMQQVFQALEFIASRQGYVTKMNSPVVDFQLYTSDNLPRSEFP